MVSSRIRGHVLRIPEAGSALNIGFEADCYSLRICAWQVQVTFPCRSCGSSQELNVHMAWIWHAS